MTDTLATLRRHLEPADQVLLAQWQAVRTPLATLLLRGPGTQDPSGYRQHIARLEAQALALEAQLSARSAAFRAQTAPVTLAAVQAAPAARGGPGGDGVVSAIRAACGLSHRNLRRRALCGLCRTRSGATALGRLG